MDGPYCGACGTQRDAADHDDAACQRALLLDPPRRCTACGFRLDVQVYPDRTESSCRECRRRARRAAEAGATS